MKWHLRSPTPQLDDLNEARKAKKATQHAVEQGRERWTAVREVVRQSRQIRQVNHLADDLKTIFGG